LAKLSRWPLFLAFVVFLFVGHILPPEQIPPAVAQANDKVLHLINFLILALLAYRTFSFSSRTFFSLHAEVKAAGFSLFYGALLEWIQTGIPGRQGDVADWLADAVGIFIASVIFRISKLPHKD